MKRGTSTMTKTTRARKTGYEIAAGALGGITFYTRWWDEKYPEGPLPYYVIAILTLLESPLVKRVWYWPDTRSVGKNITREEAHGLLDRFVAIGYGK
jgi:hypothetical protein